MSRYGLPPSHLDETKYYGRDDKPSKSRYRSFSFNMGSTAPKRGPSGTGRDITALEAQMAGLPIVQNFGPGRVLPTGGSWSRSGPLADQWATDYSRKIQQQKIDDHNKKFQLEQEEIARQNQIAQAREQARQDLLGELQQPAQQRPYWEYKPIASLGKGSFAKVSAAEINGFNSIVVAIKQFTGQAEYQKEVRNHGSLKHPCIAECYGWQSSPSLVIFLKRYSLDLLHYIFNMGNRYAEYQPTIILAVANNMLSALEYLARMGIVHLDIKPENIFVDELGGYRLGDFGLASFVADGSTRSACGTRDYISPEVYEGRLHTTQSDVFSLCVLIIWMWNRNLVRDKDQYADSNFINICAIIKIEASLPTIVRQGPVFDDLRSRILRLFRLLPRMGCLSLSHRYTAAECISWLIGSEVRATNMTDGDHNRIRDWVLQRKRTIYRLPGPAPIHQQPAVQPVYLNRPPPPPRRQSVRLQSNLQAQVYPRGYPPY